MTPDNENTKPSAYEVKDDDNLEEKDLQRSFLFGSGGQEEIGKAKASEGSGSGGEKFGENNNTPSGDDKNNPSQNAGYTNEYFRRTEPSDEHPEHTNFKDPNQSGQSNYTQANDASKTGRSDEGDATATENSDGDSNKNEPQQTYSEGTADGNDVNIPGPNETPDQQKVGE
ncbi:hypothetical protein A0256_17175 [Mucilaginibacter sp. PAMC 26640]|nr:hypothetical protein A0256_17175 [Mucilaginibacter sp. PAMC 26640]